MLFLLFFFIIEISCNLFYMNNILSPVKSPSKVLDGIFLDQNQVAFAENFPNFEFQVPRTPSPVGGRYDMQARKLLDFYDSNVNNLLAPENKISQTNPKLSSKSSKVQSETTNKAKSPDIVKSTTTALTETHSSSSEISTNTHTTTIKNFSTEQTILDLETISIISSTSDQLVLAKTVNKQLFVNSIIKDINETFKLDFEKDYKKDDFDCLICRKIVNKYDCNIYAQYDTFELINTFCCQCNNNKKKKKSEPQSSVFPYETLVVIAVFIFISILFCALFVYLSIWVYKVSKITTNDEENNENDPEKSEVTSISNEKNESMQDDKDEIPSESDKTSINTTDSLDMDKQDSSKRYANLKNLNRNNNNSISQENLNRYLPKTRSRTPSDNFLVRDIVCDEFSNKTGSKLDYSIDYRVNNELNNSDKRNYNCVARKNYHSNCTNLSSSTISEDYRDRKQTKKLNNRINRNFVFK